MTAARSGLAIGKCKACSCCDSMTGSCMGIAHKSLLTVEGYHGEAHMVGGGALCFHKQRSAVEACFAREMLHAGHPPDLAEILGFRSMSCSALFWVDGCGCQGLLRKLA